MNRRRPGVSLEAPWLLVAEQQEPIRLLAASGRRMHGIVTVTRSGLSHPCQQPL